MIPSSRFVLASLASSLCFAAAAAEACPPHPRPACCTSGCESRAESPSPIEIDPTRRRGRSARVERQATGEEWLRLTPDLQTTARHVDLRPEGALDALQRSNPEHFGQIRRVLVRMRQAPSAGPQHWFPEHVRAKDIEFSELTMKPAFPPQRLMRFTLDKVRYTVDAPHAYRFPWSVPRPHSYPMRLPH